MKYLEKEKLNKPNERIQFLLAELHSTLDLYYETINENENSAPKI